RSRVHGLGLADGLGGLLRGSLLRGRLLRSLLGGSVLGRTGLGLGLHLHGGPGLLLDRGNELLLGHVLLCALLGLQFLGRGRLLFGLLRGRGCLVTGSRATRAVVVLLVVLGALVSVALVVAVLVVACVFGSVIGVVVIALVAFALVVVLAWGTVVRGRLLAALTLCSGGRSLVASVRVALLRFVVLRVARRGGGPGRLLGRLVARLLGRLPGRRRGLGGAGLGVGRLRGRRRRGARGLLGRRLAVAAGLRRR